MSIRIYIHWTFMSPLLQIAKGILKVEDFRHGGIDTRLLFKCKIERTPGTLGYSSMDKNDESLSIPHKLFEKLRPSIDTMVRSYFQGMLLEESSYEWVEDSLDKTFEEWEKENGLKPT